MNKSNNIKDIVYDNVYDNYINFSYIKNIYNSYLGNIIPFQNIIKDEQVFNEKIKYKELAKKGLLVRGEYYE